MKKPDEIKKGLEQYMSVDAYDCEISCKDSGCPYSGDERIGAETCGDLICADALAYIQQLEAKVPKWISAKEPPEKWKDDDGALKNYLVYMPEYGVDVGNYMKPAKTWVCMGLPCKVTHWMPLPEPPEV